MPTITEPNEAGREARKRERAIKSFGTGDLFYEERWSNGGGCNIGYDIHAKRGYYEFNHH